MANYKKTINAITNAIKKEGITYDRLNDLLDMCIWHLNDNPDDRDYCFAYTDYVKSCATSLHIQTTDEKYGVLYWRAIKFEAQNKVFDSYLLYVEKNRLPKDRFYEPKRKCYHKIGLIQAYQDILDDKLDILCVSMPPGTGKTSIEKFFHSALMGWFPKEYSLFYSHSADITRMYYDGVLDIITNSSEYTWNEIFPDSSVTNTNAKLEQINIDKYKPFPNLQTTSIGAKSAGKVRASLFLLCDDLIGGSEESFNKNFLDKLWNIYSIDARQRKTRGEAWFCKEIHTATRWSVHDVIGRLEKIYENNKRFKIISIPDVDEKTGKSNFDFDINGFTVDFFKDQKMIMDDISYRCLYKGEPVEREGVLYHDEDIRRYQSLPEREPDAIIGICDTKSTGSDFMVLPVCYKYDGDYYMVDCICDDNSDLGLQKERAANLIVEHNMQQCEFESNSGGDRLAYDVNILVKQKGGRCNITTKATETNKETRIIVNSDWVKKHILFKDKNDYTPKSDYGVFMSWLLSYSVRGRNVHDDVPDCMANFALYATRGKKVTKVTATNNPLRGYYEERYGNYYDNEYYD